jgi:hypothetical protein
MARRAVRLPWRFHSINPMFGQHPLRAPCVLGGQPCRIRLQPEFRPHPPIPSSPHDHPTISPIKTSNAIRACSRMKSCAEPPTGNSKNNLAATSGISLDSAPALRQKLRNRTPSARSTNKEPFPQPPTLALPPSAPPTPSDAPQQFSLSPRSCFQYCNAHPNCPLFSYIDG